MGQVSDAIEEVYRRVEANASNPVFIHVVPKGKALERAAAVEKMPKVSPLWGKPFVVKDNIDVEGLPTTAGCPAFTYTPKKSATAVQKLLDAGAVLVGKTNMDQFATGLTGTRTPGGAVKNAFDPKYISGGSSSGSAVAVALGIVGFSLGTDTAGSGRVPAAFNGLVGFKPTRGLVSTAGVVPACRSLDCVSVFSKTATQALSILETMQGYDPADPFSRRAAPPARALPRSFAGLRFGVPREDQLQFFGNPETPQLFQDTLFRLEKLGASRVTVDFGPFLETARLLYEGPWVAERYVAIREFIERNPRALHPVTAAIIGGAKRFSANDAFAGYYRLKELQRRTAPVWDEIDILVTPTAGTIYRVDELEAEPVKLNANLGYYTNFMNLLDLAAIALPAGFQRDGLPFGVTFVAPAFNDEVLCSLGEIAQRAAVKTMGATGLPLPTENPEERRNANLIQVAVCGAHMSGLPLNYQLTERGARLVAKARTASSYRLFALTDFKPPRPGLVRDEKGAPIEVEIWEVPASAFGGFVDGIPAPLGIGTLTLENGRQVKGFLCEAHATRGAREITSLGSWRQFVKGG